MPMHPLIDPHSKVNRFALLADLGHGPDLLPIVPRGVPVSKWAKNLTPDKLGKIPSLLRDDGAVGLYSWPTLNVSRETWEEWFLNLRSQPYGIGLNARNFHAWDVDANSPEFALRCFTLLEPFYRKYGAGLRVGRAPAFLMPWRCENPWRKQRLAVRDAKGIIHAVDWLAEGQYYNLVGLHPGTGQPYQWYPNPHLGGMLIDQPADHWEPAPDAEVIEAWEGLCDGLLRDYEPVEKRSSRARVTRTDQPYPDPAAHLAPSAAIVAECLKWLPNDRAHARSRDDWLAIIRAIATATGKSGEGRELAGAWSAQWDDSPKAFSNAMAAFDSIDTARSQIGFRWLAAKAADESKGECRVLFMLDFGEGDDDPPPQGSPPPPDVSMQQAAPPTGAEIAAMIDKLHSDSSSADIVPILAAMALAGLDHVTVHTALRSIKAATKVPMKTLENQLRGERLKLVTGGDWDVPRRLAKAALAELGDGKLAFHNGRWLQYEGRYWHPISEADVNSIMHKIAAENVGMMTRPGSGAAESISTATAQGRTQLLSMVNNRLAVLRDHRLLARRAVNVNNGTLHFVEGEWRLQPHDPDDAFLYVSPVDYDPRAQCPLFDATLRDTMSRSHYTLTPRDDGHTLAEAALANGAKLANGALVERGGGKTIKVFDVADNVRLIEETCGYALTGWRGARQFVICKGEGHNGKTKLWETVQQFLPPETVHNGSIEAFQKSDFVLAQLAGKLLTITDDAKSGFELNDGVIKTISENKMVTAQIKMQQEPIHFYSTALPVILSNSWPVTEDISGGMRRRALVIPFAREYPRTPENETPWWRIWHDPAEMSGVLNRLLAGLARVIQRGYILASAAADEAFAEWAGTNMLEMQFIEARCTRSLPAEQKVEGELVDMLFGEFRHWYTEQGHGLLRGPKLRKRFRENLQHLGFEVYASGGRNRYRVRGLWLHDDVRNATVSYIEPGEDEDDDEMM